MRNFQKFGVLAVVCALSAIGAGSASAATFTSNATGSLTGKALNTQVFTFNAGQVKCTTAETSGTISSTASTEQHVTVNYKNCTAFGFANVHVSPATYDLTANGSYYIENTITINVTMGGCQIRIIPQTSGSILYFTILGNYVEATFVASGLVYTSSGGLCGSSGLNGTYEGRKELRRVGGGWFTYDP